MLRKEEKKLVTEACPIRNIVSRFGNKWSLLVMLTIADHEVVRFNELLRFIPDVSSRVLSGTLRTLEADDLVSRKVYPVVPPKVEYRLTDTGMSLIPIINELVLWAQTNMDKIIVHRQAYTNA